MNKIKYLVVHCTATKEDVDFTSQDIHSWHKQKGWSGIGYHYVVLLDGTIEVGRPEYWQGAHVKGYNHESLGVVYVGGLDENLAPKDTRNDRQKASLRCLLKELKEKYPEAEILGHRDFSKDINGNGVIEPFEFIKACPCFDAKKEYSDV